MCTNVGTKLQTVHTVLLGLYSSNSSSGFSVPPSVKNMMILLQPATTSLAFDSLYYNHTAYNDHTDSSRSTDRRQQQSGQPFIHLTAGARQKLQQVFFVIELTINY